jgi:hypothetical protein
MTEEQAKELATSIEQQFPHVSTTVVQATDMRNAPRNWVIAVSRRGVEVGGITLVIHNALEWNEAVDAYYVLRH